MVLYPVPILFLSMPLTFLNFEINEGSSITLFGLFSFDQTSGNFEAREVSTYFAGGTTEIKRILLDRLKTTK